ncbi:MAG: phosphoribosylamine--glycine ligase [Bacteroidetes bacterium]|nr:MAG: phosphoribosylamine--glycine ligase [Bacteroidota bacterium]
MKNVLIIGNGAREHAIAWKISQSKHLNQLYIIPGNPGTAQCGININIPATNFDEIRKIIWEKDIDIVIVGPEEPLVKGITDAITSDKILKDIIVIGPTQKGAMLEGSKQFAKDFMHQYNIPTAKYQKFNKHQIKEAYRFIDTLTPPYVIKADGLAAGKGVVIAESIQQAQQTIQEFFNGKFGKASENIVIEEFLSGIEVSYFILCNGKNYVLLPEAKDYKRIGENDTGLNTGGMGTVSPAEGIATKEFTDKVIRQIIEPTLNGLEKENIPYCGFIFFGLMNVNGNPYVIEYNCRLGDPETESILTRIENDLIDLFEKTWHKQLTPDTIQISTKKAATVILASKGYPEHFEKGFEIKIEPNIPSHTHIFHAGTKIENNQLLTNGGRVMAITSLGSTLQEALQYSYNAIEKIYFENKYYRKDIGQDILKISAELSS